MSSLSLRLPNSLHRRLREVAAREDISINQLIASAVAEKLSALMTAEYIQERAARGSRAKFEKVLGKIAARPPEAYDQLPASRSERAQVSGRTGRRRASGRGPKRAKRRG